MNSGSASAPSIKASKFPLAFFLLKITLKSITYQQIIQPITKILNLEHCQLLAIFVYFSQLITPKLRLIWSNYTKASRYN